MKNQLNAVAINGSTTPTWPHASNASVPCKVLKWALAVRGVLELAADDRFPKASRAAAGSLAGHLLAARGRNEAPSLKKIELCARLFPDLWPLPNDEPGGLRWFGGLDAPALVATGNIVRATRHAFDPNLMFENQEHVTASEVYLTGRRLRGALGSALAISISFDGEQWPISSVEELDAHWIDFEKALLAWRPMVFAPVIVLPDEIRNFRPGWSARRR